MAVASDPFGEALAFLGALAFFWFVLPFLANFGGKCPFCPPQGLPGNFQEKRPYTSEIEIPAHFLKSEQEFLFHSCRAAFPGSFQEVLEEDKRGISPQNLPKKATRTKKRQAPLERQAPPQMGLMPPPSRELDEFVSIFGTLAPKYGQPTWNAPKYGKYPPN